MRQLTDHRVNPANDIIEINVMDGPGAGGACHEYDVVVPANGERALPGGRGVTPRFEGSTTRISFQNGPIKECGVNGLTHEVLLAIVADRLRSFQAGAYACPENAQALASVETAQAVLQSRTKARMARGVEGTHRE